MSDQDKRQPADSARRLRPCIRTYRAAEILETLGPALGWGSPLLHDDDESSDSSD